MTPTSSYSEKCYPPEKLYISCYSLSVHRMVPPDDSYRMVPTGWFPSDSSYRMVPTVWFPSDSSYRMVLTRMVWGYTGQWPWTVFAKCIAPSSGECLEMVKKIAEGYRKRLQKVTEKGYRRLQKKVTEEQRRFKKVREDLRRRLP